MPEPAIIHGYMSMTCHICDNETWTPQILFEDPAIKAQCRKCRHRACAYCDVQKKLHELTAVQEMEIRLRIPKSHPPRFGVACCQCRRTYYSTEGQEILKSGVYSTFKSLVRRELRTHCECIHRFSKASCPGCSHNCDDNCARFIISHDLEPTQMFAWRGIAVEEPEQLMYDSGSSDTSNHAVSSPIPMQQQPSSSSPEATKVNESWQGPSPKPKRPKLTLITAPLPQPWERDNRDRLQFERAPPLYDEEWSDRAPHNRRWKIPAEVERSRTMGLEDPFVSASSEAPEVVSMPLAGNRENPILDVLGNTPSHESTDGSEWSETDRAELRRALEDLRRSPAESSLSSSSDVRAYTEAELEALRTRLAHLGEPDSPSPEGRHRSPGSPQARAGPSKPPDASSTPETIRHDPLRSHPVQHQPPPPPAVFDPGNTTYRNIRDLMSGSSLTENEPGYITDDPPVRTGVGELLARPRSPRCATAAGPSRIRFHGWDFPPPSEGDWVSRQVGGSSSDRLSPTRLRQINVAPAHVAGSDESSRQSAAGQRAQDFVGDMSFDFMFDS